MSSFTRIHLIAASLICISVSCLAQQNNHAERTFRTPRSIDQLLGDEAPAGSTKTPRSTQNPSAVTPRNARAVVARATAKSRGNQTAIKPSGSRDQAVVQTQAIRITMIDVSTESDELDLNDGATDPDQLDIDARERELDAIEKKMDAEIGSEEKADEDESAEDESEDDAPVENETVDAWSFSAMPSIRTLSIDASVSPGILPVNHAAAVFSNRPSEYHAAGFKRPSNHGTHTHWQAPWVAYRPLYFEDPWLERHGYHYGHLQPFVSAVKFYGRIPVLPYMKGASPCSECTYSLGLGRPGNCTPHFFTIPKRSCRGFWNEAALITAFAL